MAPEGADAVADFSGWMRQCICPDADEDDLTTANLTTYDKHLSTMTAQYPDRLRLKRRIHILLSEPLESYFDDLHPRPQAFAPLCSACWRGYLAGWCVKRGKLYLEKLNPFAQEWPDAEQIELTTDASGLTVLRMPAQPNHLAHMFPDAAAPVFADWFSGELRYVPVNFCAINLMSMSQCWEAASVLKVVQGRIV